MDRISRRDFFMSLVAVGVAAGLPLPLGITKKKVLPPGALTIHLSPGEYLFHVYSVTHDSVTGRWRHTGELEGIGKTHKTFEHGQVISFLQ